MKQKSNFSFLLSYAKNEKYKLYFSAFLSICSSILMVVPYILIYNIILELLKADLDYNRIKKLAIYTAILIVVRLILFILSGVFSHVAAFNILYNIRMQAVKHLGNINLGYFREKNIGEIKKAINEDVEKLENFLAHQIPDLAAAITTPIVILVFLFFLEWRIAIFLIIPIILAILTQFAMFKGYGKRLDNYNSLLQRLTSTITQYIKGMNVFKAFNLTAHSFKKYIDINNEYTENWHEMTDDYRAPYGIFLAVVDSALIFVIPSGGYLYLTDKINISTFLIFLLLSYTFLSSFKILMQFAGTFSFVLAGANNVRSIIEFPIQNDGKNLKNINFKEVFKAIKGEEGRKIIANYGMDPKLGKYNRSYCEDCERQIETKPPAVICDKCGSDKHITMGVYDRIVMIKDQESKSPKNRPLYNYQYPLQFIPGVGLKVIDKLLEAYGTEMTVLNKITKDDIESVVGPKLSEIINLSRTGGLHIKVGGGGEYGKLEK